MRKLYSIAALMALGFIFQGCGLKGPLRLPDRAKPAAIIAAHINAPALSTEK